MTKDAILRMAKEADIECWHRTWDHDDWSRLKRFANLVAAAEREECAKLCERLGDQDCGNHAWDATYAIRARGNT